MALQRTALFTLLRGAHKVHGPLGPPMAFFATEAVQSTQNVPAGHHSSDLSDAVCNISLNRRRDLTMRQDLVLYKENKQYSLADLLRGSKAIIVGFPGGKICTDSHIPGYISKAAELKKQGVDKILCISIDEPQKLAEWAKASKIGGEVEVLADKNGAFNRMLGTDLGPDAVVKMQRYAGIVEDGILLKLKVEAKPADLKVSDAASIQKLWKDIYE